MEFIKKYWNKIITILFVILFLSMCTKNCSKSNDIRQVNKVVDSLTKVSFYQKDVISSLEKKIDSLENVIDKLKLEKEIYKSTSESYKSSLDKANSKKTTISVNVPSEKIDNEK